MTPCLQLPDKPDETPVSTLMARRSSEEQCSHGGTGPRRKSKT
jgi:hypothetical protein